MNIKYRTEPRRPAIVTHRKEPAKPIGSTKDLLGKTETASKPAEEKPIDKVNTTTPSKQETPKVTNTTNTTNNTNNQRPIQE